MKISEKMPHSFTAAICLFVIAACLLVSSCGPRPRVNTNGPEPIPPQASQTPESNEIQGDEHMDFRLTSTAFESSGPIPVRYTCSGDDVSPPLQWSGAPKKTVAYALICDDPDAPRGTWVHWVAYNIPADCLSLPEAMPTDTSLQAPVKLTQGTNSSGKIGYQGPCPPSGTHRYFFKLYALEKDVTLKPGATKAELLDQLKNNIIAKTELMGTFAR